MSPSGTNPLCHGPNTGPAGAECRPIPWHRRRGAPWRLASAHGSWPASLGATLGVGQRSEVILFMTDAAAKRFMAGSYWTVGADANVALVKGAGVEYDNQTLRKPVLAFVFGEQGLIADISLEGAKVSKLHK